MICYEVRDIQWEHDGRDDDMNRYPTEFEFIDNHFNVVLQYRRRRGGLRIINESIHGFLCWALGGVRCGTK